MKKFLALMLCALPMLAMVSCDDEKDLPNVDFTVNFSDNTRYVDDILYVVQGEQFSIEDITVTNNEPNKNALITEANFYWDYLYLGSTVIPPFKFDVNVTPETALGQHNLKIECPVLAVDKEPGSALLVFNVVVVASPDDLPETGSNAVEVIPTIANQ